MPLTPEAEVTDVTTQVGPTLDGDAECSGLCLTRLRAQWTRAFP